LPSKVGVAEESQFLPGGAESVKAKDILRQKFAGVVAEGSAILVLYNPQGWYQQGKLDPDIQDMSPDLPSGWTPKQDRPRRW
jgi:hypothetical protein